MNFIRRMLKPVANATITTTKLGRWQLHYDPKVVNSKVDQANEDHCGCCHEPSQANVASEAKMAYTQKQLQKFSDSDEYYIPYVM